MNYINTKFSGRYISEKSTTDSDALYLYVLISRYDNGNPFPGVVVPGALRMNGEVTLLDANMNKLAEFKVSKTSDRSDSDRSDSSDRPPTIEELEPEFVQEVVKGIFQQGA